MHADGFTESRLSAPFVARFSTSCSQKARKAYNILQLLAKNHNGNDWDDDDGGGGGGGGNGAGAGGADVAGG